MFGRVLHCAGMLSNIGDVFYYLEKPWKWSPEHTRWLALGRPNEPELSELYDSNRAGS